MTVETKTTIQLCDIAEVEIECITCHMRVSWDFHGGGDFIPSHCKKCNAPFFIERSQEHHELVELLSLITRYSSTAHYHLKFSLGELKDAK